MARRTETSWVAAALTAALLTVVTGCRDRQPETFQVRISSIDAKGGPALPEERVRGILRRSLEHAPSYVPAGRDQRSGGKGETLMATLEYRELPDASDHGRDLMVRMVVETPRALGSLLAPDGLDVTVLLDREAGEANLAEDLQLASDRLVSILQARTDLALGSPGAAERLLSSTDPELVILTLEWMQAHPDHESVDGDMAERVLELINHHDDRVGLLAIETIGSVGRPEHVPVVLDRIQLADTSQVNRAYDALARLGGPEAAGFLEFAARNEDDPDRRIAAERALQRVAESSPSPSPMARANRGHR